METRICYPHRPLGRAGTVICYNFSDRSGAQSKLLVSTPLSDKARFDYNGQSRLSSLGEAVSPIQKELIRGQLVSIFNH